MKLVVAVALAPAAVGATLSRAAELVPEAIAEAYYQLHRQHRSAWSHEVDLRPWLERF